MSKRANSVAEAPPWKLLLWTAVAGLIFGLIGFGEIAEDWLRVARNRLHWHEASGDVVLVKGSRSVATERIVGELLREP